MSGIDNAWDEKWSEWIEWGGGECPIKNGTKYVARIRAGASLDAEDTPEYLDWHHSDGWGDIIAYRYKIKEGVDWPEPLASEATEDEEEAWQEKERQLIGVRNKYQREIKPGIWVDVYDVLHAWSVSNPALQHLLKKALQPGERGHKDKVQDMDDIVASALRARELEGNNR